MAEFEGRPVKVVIFLDRKLNRNQDDSADKRRETALDDDFRAEDVENTIKMVEEAYGTKVRPENLLGGTRLAENDGRVGGAPKGAPAPRSEAAPQDLMAALRAAAAEDINGGESIGEAAAAAASAEPAEARRERAEDAQARPERPEETAAADEREPAKPRRAEEPTTPSGLGANSPEVEHILRSLGVQASDIEPGEKDAFDLAKEELAAAARQRASKGSARPKKKERGAKALKRQAENLKKNKKSLTAIGPILVLILLLACIGYVQWNRPWQMTVNGQPIALVASKEEGAALVDRASLEASAAYGADIVFTHKAEIDYTKKDVPIKAKLTNADEAVAALKSAIQWRAQGYAILVNNADQTVYLTSEAAAQQVLNRVKEYYVPDYESTTLLQAEFVETVEIVSAEVSVEELGTADAAFNYLVQGREPLRQHTVKSGDSLWTIAQQYGMTVEQLQELNPAVNPNRMREGDVLALNKSQPILSVKMTVQSVTDEVIPFETVLKTDEAALTGSRRTVTKGVEGEKEIRYQIEMVNGVELERQVLSETVVADPVDEVLVLGSNTIQASRSSDTAVFYWPIRGKINSGYGTRGSRTHSGIDIDGEEGDPVYSAEAGKVIKASVYGAYGKCVIIDHGEGLTTLYAHLNEINVKVGQQVGAQELIGVVGMTGRTTGAHLHFEVRVDGETTNPMNYL